MPENVVDIFGELKLNTNSALKQLRDLERRAVFNINIGNKSPLGNLSKQASEFDKSLAAANSRVIAFGASVGIIGGVTRAIQEMITQSIKLSKVLTEINSILGKPSSELKKFSADLFEVAKNTGQGFDAAATAAKEFARQGAPVNEILKRTRDALILTRLSGLDLEKSVSSLTAVFNSFEGKIKDTTEIVNRFATVDAKFAVSSRDFAEAFSRVGSSAQEAGVEFNELIGIITSLQQRTARGGSNIGNALKTIFTRLQRTDTLDALEELGVGVRNIEGNTLPAIQIITSLAQKYDTLNDAQKSFISQTVAGGFQINQLKSLLGDLSSQNSVYAQSLRVANGATDDAIARNEALNQSFAALANAAGVNLQKLAGAIGENALQPALENIFKSVNQITELFTSGPISKIGEVLAKGLGQFLAGPGLIFGGLGIGKLFKQFIDFSSTAVGSFVGIGRATQSIQNSQQGIINLLLENKVLLDQINSSTISQVEKERLVISAIQQRIALKRDELIITEQLARASVSAGFSANREGTFRGGFRNKAGGNIPLSALGANASMAVANEIAGAKKHGYTIGPRDVRAMRAKIGGKLTNVVYNNREKVINNAGGTGEPVIIPPGGFKNYSGGNIPYKNAGLGFPFNFDQLNKEQLLQVAGQAGYPIDEQFRNADAPRARKLLRGFFHMGSSEAPILKETLKRGGIPTSSSQDKIAELQTKLLARRDVSERNAGLSPGVQASLGGKEAANPSVGSLRSLVRDEIEARAAALPGNISNAQRNAGLSPGVQEALARLESENVSPSSAGVGGRFSEASERRKVALIRLNRRRVKAGKAATSLQEIHLNKFGVIDTLQYQRGGAIAPPQDGFTNTPTPSAFSSLKNSLRGSFFGDGSEKTSRRAIRSAGLSFAAPFAGSALGSAISNPQGKRFAEGVGGAIGTGAAIASIAPGPAGLAIGGVVATIGVLKAAFENLTPSIQDVIEANKVASSQRETSLQGGNAANQALRELRDNPNLSRNQRNNLRGALVQGLDTLPAGKRASFLKGNQETRDNILNKLSEQNINFKSAENLRESITSEAGKTGTFGRIRNFAIRNRFINPLGIGKSFATDPFDLSQTDVGSQFVGAIPSDKLEKIGTKQFGLKLNKLQKDFSGARGSPKELGEFLSKALTESFGVKKNVSGKFVNAALDSGSTEGEKIRALQKLVEGLVSSKTAAAAKDLRDSLKEVQKEMAQAAIISKGEFARSISSQALRAQLDRDESSGRFSAQRSEIQDQLLRGAFGDRPDFQRQSDFGQLELQKNLGLIGKRKEISAFGESGDVTGLPPRLRNKILKALGGAAKTGTLQGFSAPILEKLQKVATEGQGDEATTARKLLLQIKEIESGLEGVNQEYQQGTTLLHDQIDAAKKLSAVDFFKSFDPTKPFDREPIQEGVRASLSNSFRRGAPDFARKQNDRIARANALSFGGVLESQKIRDEEESADRPVLSGLIGQFQNGLIPTKSIASKTGLTGFRDDKIKELQGFIARERAGQLRGSLGDAVNPFLENLPKFLQPGHTIRPDRLQSIRARIGSGDTSGLASDLNRLRPYLNNQGRTEFNKLGGPISTIALQNSRNQAVAKLQAEDIAEEAVDGKDLKEKLNAIIGLLGGGGEGSFQGSRAASGSESHSSFPTTNLKSSIDITINGQDLRIETPAQLATIMAAQIAAAINPVILPKLNEALSKLGITPLPLNTSPPLKSTPKK